MPFNACTAQKIKVESHDNAFVWAKTDSAFYLDKLTTKSLAKLQRFHMSQLKTADATEREKKEGTVSVQVSDADPQHN